MFNYAYDLDGGGETGAFDYTLDTTNVPTREMPVKLVAGKLQKAVAADTTILGVMAGSNFVGLNLASTIGKVRTGKMAVYRVDYIGTTKTTLANTDIGSAFDMDATSKNLNLDAVTVGQWKVIGFNTANKQAYVTLNKPVI